MDHSRVDSRQSYKVDVVLLTWNSQRYLEGLRRSLEGQIGVDIRLYIVDNGSSDGSAHQAERLLAPARVVRHRRNIGYAAACNEGIDAGSRPFVLLLNHDVELCPTYCLELCRALDERPQAGSATGKLLRAGSFPATVDSTGHILMRSGHAENRRAGQLDEGCEADVTEVFGVCAAAAVYRRAALDDTRVQCEVFPRSFFSYFEDVDLDLRLRWRSWSAYYVPTAVAYHERSGGGADTLRWADDHRKKNHVLLIIREFPATWIRRHSGEIFGYLLWDIYHELKHPTRLRYVLMVAPRLPATIAARRSIRRNRTAPVDDLHAWLRPSPYSWVPPRFRRTKRHYARGSGVTIAILGHNNAESLAGAVRSSLGQTVPACEVIVVDAGSTDQTRAVCERFKGDIRYVYQPSAHRALASNMALSLSRGEYITFLQGSDRLAPDFVARCSSVLFQADDHIAGAYTQFTVRDTLDSPSRLPEYDRRRLMRGCYHAAPALYKSQVLRQVLREWAFNPGAPEDCHVWDCWLRLHRRGYRFLRVNEALIERPTHSDDLSAVDRWRIAWMHAPPYVRHPGVLFEWASTVLGIADGRRTATVLKHRLTAPRSQKKKVAAESG